MRPIFDTEFFPRDQHLRRTFKISPNQVGNGTAFAIDHNSREFIVTALHVVKSVLETRTLSIWLDDNWIAFAFDVIGIDEINDIVVLELPEKIVDPGFDVPAKSGVALGQQMFYLGYPFNISEHTMYSKSSIPFVKRGVLSNMSLEWSKIYVSTVLNAGFSGAPLFAPDIEAIEINLVGFMIESLTVDTAIRDADGVKIGSFPGETGLARATSIDAVLRLLP